MVNQSLDLRREYLLSSVSLIASLIANIAWLLWLLEVDIIRTAIDEQWLLVARYGTNLFLGYCAIRLLHRYCGKPVMRGRLVCFIVVSFLGLLFSSAGFFIVPDSVSSFAFPITDILPSLDVLLLLAIVYFSIAYSVSKCSNASLFGYRRALLVGLYGAIVFSVLTLLKTPIALFLIYTEITLLLLLLASSKQFSYLAIWNRKLVSAGLILIGLSLPFVAYGKMSIQFAGAAGAVIGSSVIELVKNVEWASSEPSHSTVSPKSGADKIDTDVLTTTLVFNDQWLLNDSERLAVRANELMRSSDAGLTWKKEKELAFYGEAIHFDKTGLRGWVGNRYYGMEVTEDGGKTWRELTPESAYKQATGRKYREGIFELISELHLNPETGAGAFTAKCTYYFTNDFAKTWESRRFATKDGDKACLLDTPFSVNTSLKLALVKSVLYHQMYRYSESGDVWEAVCELSSSEIGINYCSDDESLSEAEKRFAEQEWNEAYFFDGTRPLATVRQSILHFGEHLVADMAKRPKETANTHWLADEGYMAVSNDAGKSWTIEQDVRDFEHILPVSTSIAFAWNYDDSIWISRNSGSSWNRFFTDEPSPPLDIETSNNGAVLWLLYPYKLVQLNTQSQTSVTVQSWQQPRYTQLGSADNGRVVWVYRENGELLSVSFDAGGSWNNFRASRAQRAGSAGWTTAAVSTMTCISEAPTCFLLRTNSTVSEISLIEGELTLTSPDNIILPNIDDDDYDGNYVDFVVSSNGENMIAMPSFGKHVYVSDNKGLSWDKSSTGSASDWYDPIAVSGDGNTLAIKRDRGLSISTDFGNSWRLVKIDAYDNWSWHYCWSHDAETLLVYTDDYLASSFNGGSSLTEYNNELLTEPWCGIGNDLLWLKTADIEISAVGHSNE